MSVSIRENNIESNKLSDLEKAELALQITGLILQRFLNKDLAAYLVSVPDLSVKFMDSIEKTTQNGSIEWGEMAEVLGAAATLVGRLGLIIGHANPWVRTVDSIQQMYFIVKDVIDPTSPIGRLYEKYKNGGESSLTMTGDSSNDVFSGGDLGDVLLGMAGNDTIRGGNGDDLINGGVGNDVLYGEKGNDSLRGGAGKDWLFGGVGKDTLQGGLGNDILTGGDGADRFFIKYEDIGTGVDTITDFKHGVDKITLEYIEVNAQNFKVVGGINQKIDSDDYVIYNQMNGNLYLKDGKNTLLANFHGKPNLTYSDFLSEYSPMPDTSPNESSILQGISVSHSSSGWNHSPSVFHPNTSFVFTPQTPSYLDSNYVIASPTL